MSHRRLALQYPVARGYPAGVGLHVTSPAGSPISRGPRVSRSHRTGAYLMDPVKTGQGTQCRMANWRAGIPGLAGTPCLAGNLHRRGPVRTGRGTYPLVPVGLEQAGERGPLLAGIPSYAPPLGGLAQTATTMRDGSASTGI